MNHIATRTEFEAYGLRKELLNALAAKGFDTPMPVQEQVLSSPDRQGDLIVQARTGSGKTLGFLLPLLNDLPRETTTPQILVLSPTRELAQQIAGEAQWLGRYMGLSTASLVGGMNMERQITDLRRGAALVVGTPGRTLDHIRRRTLRTDAIHSIVLDEGDTMLDMGFRDEIEAILEAIPSERRIWLFSATMPSEVASLTKRYLTDPSWITLCHDEDQHEDITHRVYLVPSGKRLEGLVNVLLWENPEMGLIFCHTKAGTVETMERLQAEGFAASALHGDMSQLERNSVMNAFRQGRIPFLVATNVAARGLDVQGVSHVIQIGLPDNLETFVHRSGRTGRAGQEGQNILVLTPRERGRFKAMLRASSMDLNWVNVPDMAEIAKVQRGLQESALVDGPEPTTDSLAWANELLDMLPAQDLVARLLGSYVKGLPNGYDLRKTLQDEIENRRSFRNSRDRDRRPRRSDNPRGRSSFRGRARSIKLSKGRMDEDWSVGRILATLCQALNVDRSEVGNIRMRDSHTEVELGPLASDRINGDGAVRLTQWGLLDGQDHRSTSPSRRHRDR
ncbi:MAG: DEAD/DEAH box helicase [Dethiosulfovibrio peptidovorans]|nr:MAG: DEAD/DEAH box helicase [Dethiosulfovibrio peptidovorans]